MEMLQKTVNRQTAEQNSQEELICQLMDENIFLKLDNETFQMKTSEATLVDTSTAEVKVL